MHGAIEIILDNAPSRSAELLMQRRVDAALVPVIVSQHLDDVRIVPDVCVGAREKARSVALLTRGKELEDVRSVSLDTSSRTSVVLTKIIFREFLGFEPEWKDSAPDIDAMFRESDAALVIGDPALAIADLGFRISDFDSDTCPRSVPSATAAETTSAIRNARSEIQKHDLVELWRQNTGFGFVFAMWMSLNDSVAIDFATARDEGLEHLDEIVTNYEPEIGIGRDEMLTYLSRNISYDVDDSMRAGMDLYFELAEKCGLTDGRKPIRYLGE